MSILINRNTRVICQGFTGKQGTLPLRAVPGLRHRSSSVVSRRAVVAKRIWASLVFNTVADAVKEHGRDGQHDLRAGLRRGGRDSSKPRMRASSSWSASPKAFR